MINIDELQSALLTLPIEQRMEVLSALEASVEEHFDRLAEESLRRDMAIVEQRLAELENGTAISVPWDEVRKSVFGNS